MRFFAISLAVSVLGLIGCSSSGGGGGAIPCSATKPCPGTMVCNPGGFCAAADGGSTGGASSGGSGGTGTGGVSTGGGGTGAFGGATGGFGGGTGGGGFGGTGALGGTGGSGGGTGGSGGGTGSCNPEFCPSPAPPAVKCCVTAEGPCGGDFQQGAGCQNLGLGGSSP
jgi:hypothetical protein